MPDVVPASDPPQRFSYLSLIAGIPCVVIPFLVCLTGYGAYLRLSWIIAIPALIGVSFIGLYVFRALRNFVKGQFTTLQIQLRQDNVLILVFLGFVLLSWFSGKQVRIWHCDSICREVAPAIETLRKYQAEHGSYPAKLSEVPEFARLAASRRISIREGRIGRGEVCVYVFERPDMIVYLEPDNYLCVVPLEHPVIMSFTRFYILRRDSISPGWTEDHLIWSLSGL